MLLCIPVLFIAYLSIACQYSLVLFQFKMIQLEEDELYIADLIASLNFTILIREPINYAKSICEIF